jgi:hypothetical protein
MLPRLEIRGFSDFKKSIDPNLIALVKNQELANIGSQ